VFWYCHKRGRETRLEREGLAAQEGESALASSASSITDDADSLLSTKAKASTNAQDNAAEGSGKDIPKERNLEDNDLPSVSHLPDPKTVPLPETPAKEKEEPVKSA